MKLAADTIPILKDHNAQQIVGHSDAIDISQQSIVANGVVSGAGAAATEVKDSSRNGFPWRASVGARIEGKPEFVRAGRLVDINGRSQKGPFLHVKRSTLGEISFVPIAADATTSATVAATAPNGDSEMDKEFVAWLEARGFATDHMSEQQVEALQTIYDAEQAKKKTDEDAVKASESDESRSKTIEDIIAEERELRANESRRVAKIIKICAGSHHTIEATAIEEGWDETKTELAKIKADRGSPNGPAIHAHQEPEKNEDVIIAAMCLTQGSKEDELVKDYGEKTIQAARHKDLHGYSLQSLCYDTIAAAGMYIRPGVFGDSAIKATKEAIQLIKAGSGMSTLSLPSILADVANKALLGAYNMVDNVAARISASRPVNDFKQSNSYRLTGQGEFLEVGPGGELKHAQLQEEAFSNQAKTYGRMLALTRTMLINDDLGAFNSIPTILGRKAATKLQKQTFTILLANAGSFFSTGNNNYFEGAGTTLQISQLTVAEQKFLDQTDQDGDPVLITPAILLVPTALKVTAQQLMVETRVNETTTTDTPSPANNPHAGKWRPEVSPFLNGQGISGQSATAWYLLGDPRDVPILEIAYLNGRQTPFIESSDADFEVLGTQWRGYFDFGVALQDKRGGVKSKGAA